MLKPKGKRRKRKCVHSFFVFFFLAQTMRFCCRVEICAASRCLGCVGYLVQYSAVQYGAEEQRRADHRAGHLNRNSVTRKIGGHLQEI